ncbi:unnamed protein product [Amoebophrya sp. A25]|nr:unnamed protein product [Amoebophrya sp. A25]|eukprot:GSA25T00003750001.1
MMIKNPSALLVKLGSRSAHLLSSRLQKYQSRRSIANYAPDSPQNPFRLARLSQLVRSLLGIEGGQGEGSGKGAAGGSRRLQNKYSRLGAQEVLEKLKIELAGPASSASVEDQDEAREADKDSAQQLPLDVVRHPRQKVKTVTSSQQRSLQAAQEHIKIVEQLEGQEGPQGPPLRTWLSELIAFLKHRLYQNRNLLTYFYKGGLVAAALYYAIGPRMLQNQEDEAERERIRAITREQEETLEFEKRLLKELEMTTSKLLEMAEKEEEDDGSGLGFRV